MDWFMELIGVDVNYIKLGCSYFIVENYIWYFDELVVGDCFVIII